MRIVWVGFHEEGILAFESLAASRWKPIAALTLNEKRKSRRSAAVNYSEICNTNSIPLHEIGLINSAKPKELLRALSPDLLIVIGWSQILDEEVLRIPSIGTIGAHASMLPHNRGSAPVNWAIIRGETESGNSLMWLNPGVDTGELIGQRSFPIQQTDTCKTVYAKVAVTNREMILELLTELEAGNRPGKPQPKSDEELLPPRAPEDGLLDWSCDAKDIYNFVRALTRPYPGAFTYIRSTKCLVWRAALLEGLNSDSILPGTIAGSAWSSESDGCGLLVQCGCDAVLLQEIEIDEVCLKGADLAALDWKGERFAS